MMLKKRSKRDIPPPENKIKNGLKKFSEKENDNKTAVIIGASSGIGYATAAKLIEQNYNVINLSRNPCNIEKVSNCSIVWRKK